MVQVFSFEKDFGLEAKLISDTSIAFVVEPKRAEKNSEELFKTLASNSEFPRQIDLFYFESILASVGWNKNDDIMTAEELVKAAKTPIDKKINYMHDERDVIGHMISSYYVDDKSRWMPIDGNPPESATFHLGVGGVLYSKLEDPILQNRIDGMISELATDRWRVSMECLYPHFDYGVEKDGKTLVIERNEGSSYLTKYLKRYGGDGTFLDYKIGRVLRNMVFSGKGMIDTKIVEQANPYSVITKTQASDNKIKVETKMADYTEAQYNEMRTKLEKAEASMKEAADKEKAAFQATISQLEKDKTSLNAELSAAKEVAKAHENKVASVEKELTSTKDSLTKANDELAKVAKEATKAKRLAMFSGVDVDEAKASEYVAKFADASDEMFSEFVNALPKKSTAKKIEDDPARALNTATITDNPGSVPTDTKTDEAISKAKAWVGTTLSKSNTKKKGE